MTGHPRSGRNPLAIYLLGLCVTAGLSFVAGMLAGSGGMKPVERLMPLGLVMFWYLLLFLGGLMALAGIFLRDVVASLLVERGGLAALTAAGSVYAMALIPLHQYMSGLVVVAFVAACALRMRQIQKELRAMRTAP